MASLAASASTQEQEKKTEGTLSDAGPFQESFANGSSAHYIESLYDAWLSDPKSVPGCSHFVFFFPNLR